METKFRAWNGRYMEYGGFSIHASSGKIIDIAEGLSEVKVDSPIMQCTGIKDKNGALLFDKDIFKAFKNIFKVYYHNGAFGYSPSELWGFIPFAGNHHFNFDTNGKSDKIEIIGNEFKTPELLE